MPRPVVIAGGGLAAVRTAQALRDLDFSGEILLVSEEPELPYDRPPLSKDFLLGRSFEEDVRLLSEEQFSELGVELRLGCRATGAELAERRLHTDAGEAIEYDQLVVATGARPVRLPVFGDIAGVTYLRGLEEARWLREQLRGLPRVGIVGGGFIGLEIAAVASELGCAVTVVEAAEEPLAPVLGAEIGAWMRTWHERHGVDFRCGSPVVEVQGAGRIERLLLEDGNEVRADVAVVGVGVRANVAWLAGSGLELHRGLVCDPGGRSSDGHVFGAGDATCRHTLGACTVSGHWTAAGEQARAVAASVLGITPPRPPAMYGYFWSDQFGKRLQFAGSVPERPEVTLLGGSVQEERFLASCGSEGVETALLALDSPREFVRHSLALRRARAAAAADA